MTAPDEDTKIALAAATAITAGRDPRQDFAAILVTLEHTVATVLLATMRDPKNAASMLNEGLVPGVEERISLYYKKTERN